jgi:hypothetical protein
MTYLVLVKGKADVPFTQNMGKEGLVFEVVNWSLEWFRFGLCSLIFFSSHSTRRILYKLLAFPLSLVHLFVKCQSIVV